MIYTRSSQYAIRAMRYLSRHREGGLSRLEDIAREEEIPQAFLGKLMQRLVKRRLVRSLKGVNGGFALIQNPDQISLFMIIDAIDDLSFRGEECIFGDKQCSEVAHCTLHERWKGLRSHQTEFLRGITLADVLCSATLKDLAPGK